MENTDIKGREKKQALKLQAGENIPEAHLQKRNGEGDEVRASLTNRHPAILQF